MNYEEVIMFESSRRAIYKGLSKCYQLPEGSLGDIVGSLETQFSELSSQTLRASKILRRSFNESRDLKVLHLDFCRLFVGPYSLLAPPYGSVYLEKERRIMCESTMDTIQYYRRAGMAVAATFKEAPDHIAAELEFMYFLIHEELRALENGDTKGFYEKLCFQQEFVANHLNQWTALFAGTVKNNAKTDFYVHLADVLDTFIAEDANYLIHLQVPQAVDA